MKRFNNKDKRKLRVRKKLKKVNNNKLRLSVFKSLKNMSVQIIDDAKNKTLVSASSVEKDLIKSKKTKSDMSLILGETLAKRAKEKKINKVYFDRGKNKYHGRIKILADSLRKNGMEF